MGVAFLPKLASKFCYFIIWKAAYNDDIDLGRGFSEERLTHSRISCK